MARYIATDANGNYVNLIEIDVKQIDEYQNLTGLTLELSPTPDESPDPDTMESALNTLGVVTRE